MKKIIPLILIFVLIFSACGKLADAAESPSPNTDTSPVVDEPTVEPTVYRNPLTGEVVDSEPANTRPYAFMINNIVYAQPQCSVSDADIIYEILAEGDITRMMAIYSDISGIDVMGSIRSSRPYYIEIANSLDAIYVHAGGSEDAYAAISSKHINNIDGVRGAYSGTAFYRDPSRAAHGTEHSLFTSGERILKATSDSGYRTEHEGDTFDYGLNFSDKVEMKNGAPANSLTVSFSGIKTTSFSYNAFGTYSAKQFDSNYIDGNTGEDVQFKNILVLYAEHQMLDSYGRRGITLNATGTGHFICDGEMVDIIWSHAGDGETFHYSLADGTPLTLGVGKTYIAIVSPDSQITAE